MGKSTIKKFDKMNEQETNNFLVLKNLQTNNLDWCKWAGWIDTDGTIWFNKKQKEADKPYFNRRVCLSLRDKQPVELLSDFFKTDLSYWEYKTITPEPYKREYLAKIFATYIYGKRGTFFMKKIYPFMLNETKKRRIVEILGYTPESKKLDDWTKEETVSYFATALEGDGHVRFTKNKIKKDYLIIEMSSSDAEYLSLIKFLIDKHFNTCLELAEKSIYKTEKGIKTKYKLYIKKVDELFNMLVVNDIMTLDRKKNEILKYTNQGQ